MNRTIVVRRDYLHYIKKYQVRCACSSSALEASLQASMHGFFAMPKAAQLSSATGTLRIMLKFHRT